MGRVETDGGFWLVLGLMVLLFPLRFLAGVILAAAVHEAGHLLAIRCTGSRVLRLELHSGGARIVTDPREPGQEILCAPGGTGCGSPGGGSVAGVPGAGPGGSGADGVQSAATGGAGRRPGIARPSAAEKIRLICKISRAIM